MSICKLRCDGPGLDSRPRTGCSTSSSPRTERGPGRTRTSSQQRSGSGVSTPTRLQPCVTRAIRRRRDRVAELAARRFMGDLGAGRGMGSAGPSGRLGCGLTATSSPCASSGRGAFGRRGRGSWCRTSPTSSCSGFRKKRRRRFRAARGFRATRGSWRTASSRVRVCASCGRTGCIRRSSSRVTPGSSGTSISSDRCGGAGSASTTSIASSTCSCAATEPGSGSTRTSSTRRRRSG